MRGRLIVFEGLDGTGKSTAARLLADCLGAVLLDTPGAALRPLRATIEAGLGHDPLALELFYAATVRAVGWQARELNELGLDVVIDRYWLSTLAYAGHRGPCLRLDELASCIPAADQTFLLTLPHQVRVERMVQRGLDPNDRATMDPLVAMSIEAGLRTLLGHALAGRGQEVSVIDQSPEQVVARMLAELDDAVGPRVAPPGQVHLFPV